MIDKRIQLSVVYDDSGVYTDHSVKAVDFSRDTFDVLLKASGNDFLYVGFYKPFNAIYVEITSANTGNNELIAQYWDGSAWTIIPSRDETKDLQRSGFVTWDKHDDWAKTTVNGESLYWMRFNPTAANTNTTIRGLNLVFCDDATLKQEFFEVDSEHVLPRGELTHIMSHVAARNEIMSELRAKGYIKTNATTGYENITQWDLLDVYEVREAAKYKALSNIFFTLSDDMDDHWYVKHDEYADRYRKAMDGLRLSIDLDDDGVKDDSEKLQRIKISRLVY